MTKIDKVLKELQQYRAIGTIEQCRVAREKTKPKKPYIGSYTNPHERQGKIIYCYECPNCDTFLGNVSDWKDENYRYNNCPNCGQELTLEDKWNLF